MRRRRWRTGSPWPSIPLLAMACVLAARPSGAQEVLQIPVERHTLPNGLRVVLSPDPAVPVVSIAVYYDVGARNERSGRSGFAHLFEHMMFQGSDNVGKAEHFVLINNNGGTANGTTNSDRTNYFETLPSHQLALGLWLEADRMRSLAVTAENFENQRDVVINEYRQSYENTPYGLSWIRINELAYGEYFPYAHPVIGSVDDLRAAPLADVQAFWREWYGPNNAVLSLVGDFETAEALELVERYFGSIPTRPTPQWQDPGFGGQTSERRESMTDPLAPLPAFYVVYHIPPARTEDHYALEHLATILGDGESSRLWTLLVQQRQMCLDVRAYTDDRRGPDLINIEATVAAGHEPGEVRELIYQEIDRIAREGVTDREMTKAHNRTRAGFVFGLQTTLHRALRLAEFEAYYGDAGLLRTELARYLAVTADDVRRVAARYLVQTNRTVLDVLPGEVPTEGEEGEQEEGGR